MKDSQEFNEKPSNQTHQPKMKCAARKLIQITINCVGMLIFIYNMGVRMAYQVKPIKSADRQCGVAQKQQHVR